MREESFALPVGGKPLTATFSDLANQADGSVLLRYGNTLVLATAVMSDETREGLDYFPLTVDYEEKFYAAWQILGSRFVRREGKPSEEAILSGRVVDRTIRPLFPRHLRNEVQVVITVLSIGGDDPDVVAVNAASLALATSDIPWNGPVAAVRVGKRRGEDAFIVNPTYADRNSEGFELELLACGRDGLVNMIEVEARQAPETLILEALDVAAREIARIQEFQEEIAKERGRKKREAPAPEIPREIEEFFAARAKGKLESAIMGTAGKKGIGALEKEWLRELAEAHPEADRLLAAHFFSEKVSEFIHREAVERGRRADGRALDEVRPLFAKAGGVSPILHGSGIFYRGGTHVFSALTLGGPQDSLIVEGMEEQEVRKHFMHHYNFPPFSSGETGRVGGTNRRMIGHGALAEKALRPVIPPKEKFPYTIRLVSECMASNGSTSMASVCASTLALMDGGVPIENPVAGIAIGLMTGEKNRFAILTDIQGPEDEHGDMDFKVAGTAAGITAIQLDVKVKGVAIPVLAEALEAAKKARAKILEVIAAEIPAPRSSISPNAPEIITMRVKRDQVGTVIGPGGKTVNRIKEETGVEEITLEDDGTIFITGKMGSAERAAEVIRALTREYLPGERFEGEVTRMLDFGAFVKIGPTAEGLVHISEVAPFRIDRISRALSLGERVPVVVKEIDEKGRINLSIKAADPEFASRKGLTPGPARRNREP